MRTNQSANGTSFHGEVFTATVDELIWAIGEPDYDVNDGSDKVNFEWVTETPDGKVFTIYDWKEYRKLSKDEPIEWHIGAHDKWTSMEAEKFLNSLFE